MPTYRRLKSGNWQAGVFHPSGGRYYKTDPLKRVVKDWAEDLELQIRRGTFVDPNDGKMTLDQWWKEWSGARAVARQTASKTETHWRLYVQPAFGTWPLATIGNMDVQRWIARLDKEGMSREKPEAFATAVRLLLQLLDAAVAAKKIGTNPAKGLKAPTPPDHVDRVFEYAERELLLSCITKVDWSQRVPRDKRHPRIPDPENQLFVKLMLDAGLRWQEAAGQHIFRIDRKRKRLRVQEVVERGTREIKPKPKTKAGARWAPLTDDLLEDIDAYLELHPTKDGLLFQEDDGGPIDYRNWLKRVWDPAVKAAKLDDPQPTPHDCRHTYGTDLAEAGVPPHEIMVLMGHSTLRAVERYLHASEARMERARKALGDRAKKARKGQVS